MGNQATCLSRESRTDCCAGRSPADGEEDEQYRVAIERDRLLTYVEGDDDDDKIRRFYTVQEFSDLQAFRSNYCSRSPTRQHTLRNTGAGPWGISDSRGGDQNAWDDVDGTVYKVRGGTYLADRKKEDSGPCLAELCVVDLFMSNTDVARASKCEEAKTVQRLRRAGETRKLLILNFRVVPLHVIIVWALPPTGSGGGTPAQALLERFVTSMTDEERDKRLKVIPRIIAGPWPIRKLVGENCPAILGKGIPVKYFADDNELEVSVSITASGAAQRVSKAMLRAGSALNLELVTVIEGQAEDELPEQVLGGFRVIHADLTAVRMVAIGESEDGAGADEEPRKPQLERPSFLPG